MDKRSLLIHLFVGLFFLATSMNVKAQLNESDSSKWQAKAGFSFFRQKGTVNLLIIRGDLVSTVRLKGPLVFKTQNWFLYQEFDNTKTDNEEISQNFIFFKPSNRVYPLAAFYVTTNFRRQIRERYSIGVGGTYQPIIQPNHNLKLSASTMRETSTFSSSDYNLDRFDGQESFEIWRLVLYLNGSHKILSDKLSVNYLAFVEPAFKDLTNYRSRVEFSLVYNVWKGLSMTYSYLVTHESLIVEEVEETDGIFTLGINYQVRKD